MMRKDISDWVRLNLIPGVGGAKYKKLLDYFGSPERVLLASRDELCLVEGVNEQTAKNIIEHRNKVPIEKELKLIQQCKIKLLVLADEDYPQNLKSIYDPPMLLYVKGNLKLQDNISIAIVGTRRATVYGKTVTEKISGDLGAKNITVISGMARGIDTQAHRGCLAKGGRTIAVLGSGLAHIYPPENRDLAEKIASQGAVISEFPMETKPDRGNFPLRNRVISGLSLGTVIIEAGEKSGALITTDLALEQGREVFAVPGNIFSRYSKGTHKLIKQGAKLVETADDIIEEIRVLEGLFKKKDLKSISTENHKLNSDEQIVYDILELEPLHVDQICQRTQLPINKINQILFSLEMKGLARQLPGKNYIRPTK